MSESDKDNSQDRTKSFSPESWNMSAKYAALIGQVPASFSATIRTFITDQQKAGSPSKYQPSENVMYSLKRIMRSDSLKAPIYFAASSMHKDKMSIGQTLDEKALMNIMGADILCALIGIVFLYRKTQALCDLKQWENLIQDMHTYMELGAALGYAIPNIGTGVGLSTGALRLLAQGLFLSKDEKGFKAYRREIGNSNKSYDLALEEGRWGCNHLQVSAKLLQALGYGLPYATGFTFGLGAVDAIGLENDEAMYRWWITGKWIESLKTTSQPPDMTHKGRYYPEKVDLDKLLNKVKELNATSSPFLWMEKRKEDLISVLGSTPKAESEAGSDGSDNEEPIDNLLES